MAGKWMAEVVSRNRNFGRYHFRWFSPHVEWRHLSAAKRCCRLGHGNRPVTERCAAGQTYVCPNPRGKLSSRWRTTLLSKRRKTFRALACIARRWRQTWGFRSVSFWRNIRRADTCRYLAPASLFAGWKIRAADETRGRPRMRNHRFRKWTGEICGGASYCRLILWCVNTDIAIKNIISKWNDNDFSVDYLKIKVHLLLISPNTQK